MGMELLCSLIDHSAKCLFRETAIVLLENGPGIPHRNTRDCQPQSRDPDVAAASQRPRRRLIHRWDQWPGIPPAARNLRISGPEFRQRPRILAASNGLGKACPRHPVVGGRHPVITDRPPQAGTGQTVHRSAANGTLPMKDAASLPDPSPSRRCRPDHPEPIRWAGSGSD